MVRSLHLSMCYHFIIYCIKRTFLLLSSHSNETDKAISKPTLDSNRIRKNKDRICYLCRERGERDVEKEGG